VPLVSPDVPLSLDFRDPRASLALCRAQLAFDLGINVVIPLHHLCPPVARTHSYLSWAGALAITVNQDTRELRRRAGFHTSSTDRDACSDSRSLRLLDVGTGASAVFPLVASRLMGFVAVATELDPESVHHARRNVILNSSSDSAETLAPAAAPPAPEAYAAATRLSSPLPLPPFSPAVAVLRAPSPDHFFEDVVPGYPPPASLAAPLAATAAQKRALRRVGARVRAEWEEAGGAGASADASSEDPPSELVLAGAVLEADVRALLSTEDPREDPPPPAQEQDSADDALAPAPSPRAPWAFELLTCNPPFFSADALDEARASSRRTCAATLCELACEGGEVAFVTQVRE
jgi:hypothetical protein